MFKISDSNRKVLYYVSNVKTGTLTIIDGSCNSIVKNIFVGKRPFKVAVVNNNDIYVACDRSNSIAVVDCLSGEIRTIYIPNNGNVEIDKLNEKMYISNTSEVVIYDIREDKKLSNITGFLAISHLKLSKDSSKLYVMDKLTGEFRIYSTVNFKLIYSIKDLGINPGFFLVSDDDKTAYISIENNSEEKNGYNILKMDINKNKITGLALPKGSVIAGMLLRGSTLYAANKGLNRIELINIKTFKAYGFILTSMSQPNRLCLTDDDTKLLVVDRNSEGQGGIDIIDITTNALIGRVLMDSYNSQPYDVGSVSIREPVIYNVPVAITNLGTIKESVIITKRVLACYRENIYFSKIVVNLCEHNDVSYALESIKFDNGFIVKGSEIKTATTEMPGFSRVQFILRISYTIHYAEENGKKNIFNGFLEKLQDIIFAVPKERDVDKFEFIVGTITKLMNTPSLIGNVLSFGVAVHMELKITDEDQRSTPALKHNSQLSNYKEEIYGIENHYEIFYGRSGSIFPKGTVLPYLEELDD